MKVRSIISLVAIFLLGIPVALSQESAIMQTFYDTRIVNGHSTETNTEGELKFIISHRFGRVNTGAYELFGLDNSTIRIGLDYGITRWFTVGVGRSSFEKTFDGFFKARILQQERGEGGMPVSVSFLSGMAINTLPFQDTTRENYFTSRLFYNYNLLISRRFGDRLSLQLMPSLVHRNLVRTAEERHDVFSLGTAARFLMTKRMTLSFEYYYVFPEQLANEFNNSLALGINFETKGHVFQLHFGNSRGMIEKFFITETIGEWSAGDIHFGFNITRDFKIKGRKH